MFAQSLCESENFRKIGLQLIDCMTQQFESTYHCLSKILYLSKEKCLWQGFLWHNKKTYAILDLF